GSLELANLPRMLGVKSIGGYQGCPDFDLWRLFDPAGDYQDAYNQCGYAAFDATTDWDASFSSPDPDVFFVAANPLSSAFAAADVRYFVVANPAQIDLFAASGRFRQVFSYAGRAIFERR